MHEFENHSTLASLFDPVTYISASGSFAVHEPKIKVQKRRRGHQFCSKKSFSSMFNYPATVYVNVVSMRVPQKLLSIFKSIVLSHSRSQPTHITSCWYTHRVFLICFTKYLFSSSQSDSLRAYDCISRNDACMR